MTLVKKAEEVYVEPSNGCPGCGSSSFWRDGWRTLRNGDRIQRFLCRSCGRRFSQSRSNFDVKVYVPSQIGEKSNPRKDFLQSDVFQGDFTFEPSIENTSFKRSENVASQSSSNQTIIEKQLNSLSDYNRDCRVGVSERGMKNLAKVETRNEKWAAGATSDKYLLNFAWELKKQGYKE